MLSVDALLTVLSTITSPAFCELVFELSSGLSRLSEPPLQNRGRWGEVDRLLEERFSNRGDFRFIIRTGQLRNHARFQRYAAKNFPLLLRRGCVHFETSSNLVSDVARVFN